MTKSYRFNIPGDPEKFIARTKKMASENSAVVKGTARKGSLSLKGVEGDYRVEGNTANLTIVKKPFYVTWGRLEKEISRFFGGPPLNQG